jgi:general secretion pathway protein G
VVAIIATLSGIAVPIYFEYIHTAKVVRAVGDINQISFAIDTYRIRNRRLPNSLDEVGCGDRLDPWGQPYQYLDISIPKNSGHSRKDHRLVPLNSDYDLYSIGRDGGSMPPLTAKQSWDDIVRANNGGFIGLASNY